MQFLKIDETNTFISVVYQNKFFLFFRKIYVKMLLIRKYYKFLPLLFLIYSVKLLFL